MGVRAQQCSTADKQETEIAQTTRTFHRCVFFKKFHWVILLIIETGPTPLCAAASWLKLMIGRVDLSRSSRPWFGHLLFINFDESFQERFIKNNVMAVQGTTFFQGPCWNGMEMAEFSANCSRLV